MGKQKKKLKLMDTFMITIVGVAIIAVVTTVAIIVPRASKLLEKSIQKQMLFVAQSERDILDEEKLDAVRGGMDINYDFYSSILRNVNVQDLKSSYAYLVSADGTMLYHPTEEKVGESVENTVVKGLVEQLQSGKVPDDAVVSYEFNGQTKYAGYAITDMNQYMADAGNYQILVVTADKAEAMKDINSLTIQAVLFSAIILIILIIIGFFVVRKITRPLLQIATATDVLADGHINTPIEIDSTVMETAQIVDAIQRLQQTLQSIAGNIKTATGALADSVDNTNALCISSSNGANSISNTFDELSHTAMSMADSVQLLNTEMMDIGENINSIMISLDNLSESSQSMNDISDKAKHDINDVFASSQESVRAVGIITEHITELSSAINEVTEATNIIAGISSQTSLLALNASIEAARAGEAGRGFAVVATEISNLASQSDDSTKQIDEIINKVLELSKKSVSMAESIKNTIAEEQTKVQQTQDSFLELKAQIDNSVQQISQISTETDKLTASKDKALSSVSDLSAISQENAASNEAVTNSVSDLSLNISDIAAKTGDMTTMAETLSSAISAFKDE